jgi:hypothetical protein
MTDCEQTREQLALHPHSDDERLNQHLVECPACASYRRPHQALDAVLRTEMHWEAPAALTARLLALTAAAPIAAPIAVHLGARPRPKGWYVTIVYVLTMLAISLSLLVAWQFFGLLATQIGLGDALTRLVAAPAQGLAQLTQLAQAQPESRYLIAFFLKVRDQLTWLLLVAVLWAALDRWNPQFSFRGRQISS